MDPLDTPEPLALINRQDPDRWSSGPTLAPPEALFEEEPEDRMSWEDDLAADFFTTLDPAPVREIDDEPIAVVRRSPLPVLLFAGAMGAVMMGALALVGAAWLAPEPAVDSDSATVASAVVLPDLPADPVGAAPVAAEPVATGIRIPYRPVSEIGETDGDVAHRRERTARKVRKTQVSRTVTARFVPAPKPGPVTQLPPETETRPTPMRVDALQPVSVQALPPADTP